jgi:hypothetical protein
MIPMNSNHQLGVTSARAGEQAQPEGNQRQLEQQPDGGELRGVGGVDEVVEAGP